MWKSFFYRYPDTWEYQKIFRKSFHQSIGRKVFHLTSSSFYDGMGFYWSHSSSYMEDRRQKCNRKMSKNNDNYQRYIKLKTPYFVLWIKCNLLRCFEKGEKKLKIRRDFHYPYSKIRLYIFQLNWINLCIFAFIYLQKLFPIRIWNVYINDENPYLKKNGGIETLYCLMRYENTTA